MPDKALTMKWDVFRDKLRPGQEEEWRLTIKTPQGTPADAEMLATMYDASLDKLYPNRQNFNVNYPRFNPQIYLVLWIYRWSFLFLSFLDEGVENSSIYLRYFLFGRRHK